MLTAYQVLSRLNWWNHMLTSPWNLGLKWMGCLILVKLAWKIWCKFITVSCTRLAQVCDTRFLSVWRWH